MKNELWRDAEEWEIRDYEAVENVIKNWSNEEANCFLYEVSDFVLENDRKARQAAYNKIRHYLIEYEWSTAMLEHWYFLTEEDE